TEYLRKKTAANRRATPATQENNLTPMSASQSKCGFGGFGGVDRGCGTEALTGCRSKGFCACTGGWGAATGLGAGMRTGSGSCGRAGSIRGAAVGTGVDAADGADEAWGDACL